MKLLKSAEIIVKKSRFISYYYEINDFDEIKEILNDLKSEHKKAKHIVYAYKFGNTAGKSDDKEPKGTAGLPLYNLLETKNLNNRLIVVVRYFGGTLLGAGLLQRTYRASALEAIKND
ncbi:MAG TPA: YigZ family protein [Candidatus Onthocola stercorigallinarum]|nr:YigZ family protein [Candidatus Onthocola stercorigallinarum]